MACVVCGPRRPLHRVGGARLVEITSDVRRVLGLRETRNGLSVPGGCPTGAL